MNLTSEREVINTREKLQRLESVYEEVLAEPSEDEELRQAELNSLKRLINQLKEEIAVYKAHQLAPR